MKAFWTTIAATAVLLVIWSVFISYADVDVDKMTSDIDAATVAIEADDWVKSRDALADVAQRWHDRRLTFSLFFDAVSIGDVEASLARAQAYCRSEEKGSALAELAYLSHLLLFLYENELITLENIL
jgi:hypothetical protein